MPRYKIWDKQEDIYTLGADKSGKAHWTAEEYISTHAPWAAIPTVKVIVGGGAINGTVFMEYEATVEHYKKQGAAITSGMTDAEVLAAIEDFEDNPPPLDLEPTPEERMAAAMESLAATGIGGEANELLNILLGVE